MQVALLLILQLLSVINHHLQLVISLAVQVTTPMDNAFFVVQDTISKEILASLILNIVLTQIYLETAYLAASDRLYQAEFV